MTYEEWNETAEQILPDSYWAEQLNAPQLEAVRHTVGPLLVIAGAGSGKTRVLTYKIAYLLQHGYKPYEILALTFTNKAASEMTRRIHKIVGTQYARGLWSGTFHSIFTRILRTECEHIGLQPNFTVLDSADQLKMIKNIIKELGLDSTKYKDKTIAGRISNAKNRLILPEDYTHTNSLTEYDRVQNIERTSEIYRIYWERCRMLQMIDFDDMLLYTFLLFSRNETIRRKYTGRFKYILVDEYQDTNYLQYKILELLTQEHHNICVVGDDAQSIYAFRGANIENILRFNRQFPEAVTVKLEQNYRSTQTIVNAANDIIRHNVNQIPKKVFSSNDVGTPLLLIQATNDREEAAKICGYIKRLNAKDHVDFDKIAILYRTNAQSRPLEETFLKNGIPYKVYAGQSFYERKEIKDVLGYLKLIVNSNDEEAFIRIVNYPTRGIGNTTLQKLLVASHAFNVSLWAVMEAPEMFGLKFNAGTLTKFEMFTAMIREFQRKAQETEVYQLVKDVILYSGIADDLRKDDSPEGESRRENIEELLGSIYNYMQEIKEAEPDKKVFLHEYLSEVALMTDADKHDDGKPKVALMTIHAAKGLEFDTVFIAGMEQDLIPSSRSAFSPKEYEEERRLFYVAVTRAEKRCFLSYACSRFRNGAFEISEHSEFLDEIDSKYIRHEHDLYDITAGLYKKSSPTRTSQNPSRFHTTFKRPTPTVRKTILTTAEAAPKEKVETLRTAKGFLKVGTRIRHERFGLGVVEALEGKGENAMAHINFDVMGKKKLLLKFAVYTILYE